MPTRIKPDAASLRELLTHFKEIPPKVKTETRRALRGVGDDIIAGQRAILDGPLPAGITITGRSTVLRLNKKTGKYGLRTINKYGDQAVKRPGRSSGLREGIKAGLVTRVVTGESRQSIEIKTQNSKGTMSTGWNSTKFKHPVFGKKNNWVLQAGQPYFFEPVFKGRDAMIANAIDILNNAVEGK
jgi:hypothetical protein